MAPDNAEISIGGLPNWSDYVRALHLRFGHTLNEDTMAELVGLRQIGNVQDF